jgi:hypothetical protein
MVEGLSRWRLRLPLHRGRLSLQYVHKLLDTVDMNSDVAKQQALQLFKPNSSGTKIDYEARSRKTRQKIEALRSLALAARTRGDNSKTVGSTDWAGESTIKTRQ